MRNTRKIISVLLSILMIITSVPLMAVESFAADEITSGVTGDCTWSLDGTVLTISGNGKMEDYGYNAKKAPWGTLITKAIIENGVTRIGGLAFTNCPSLTSVTIPDSVTSIGWYAFKDCTSLTSVTIPDSVTEIGMCAFENTAYYNNSSNWDNGILYIGNHLIKAKKDVSGNVEIRQGTKTIADSAFIVCRSLTSVTIPNSVTSISYDAFEGCKLLTNITIPDSVTSIDLYAFKDCTSLERVTISDSVTRIGMYAFENTAYYNNSSNWDNGILYIGNHLIKAKSDIYGSIEIKQGTKTIADSAFFGCPSLTSITIPDSITSMGYGVFSGINELVITGSIAGYEYNATAGVKNLILEKDVIDTDINFDNLFNTIENITVSEENAVYSSIDGVLFNKDKTELIRYPRGKKETSYKIPNGVTSISDHAFYGCSSLTNVTIPDSVTSIREHAFSGCTSLTNVTIPDSVTSISDYAFNVCTSLTSITIPDSVTSISDYAFRYCKSLTSVTIGNGVTSIGDYAFWDCTSLASVTIGNGVTSIGDSAFWDCTSLASITIPDSVTSIGDYAFRSCTSLSSITIPDSVMSIGRSAFLGCTSLTSITIPSSVINIDGGICGGCTSLETAKIETELIPSGTFGGCTSLKEVTLGDGVKEIYGEGADSGAFSGCSALESIKIPAGVTSIRPGAFYRCTSLTNIDVSIDNKYYSSFDGILYNKDKTELLCYPLGKSVPTYSIPNGVTSIGCQAFELCTSLESVIIPDSVTNIETWAFKDCTSLTSITIPDSVTNIGWDAFLDCTSLSDIVIGNGVTYIGRNPFANTAYYNDESNWDNGILYIGNYLISAKSDITGDVVIKEGTRVIAEEALRNCDSLTSITIPESVTTLCDLFYGDTALTKIEVSSKNKSYSSLDGALFNKDKTELLWYPTGKNDPTYSIPDSVTSIETWAFSDCTSLTSITIPNSVTSIDYGAFSGCTSLNNITIPDSVTSIGDGAFSGCTSLNNITIPDSVTSIGDGAFWGTAYYNDESNWDNGILYIGNHLIEAKRNISGSVEIKQGTKVIAGYAFYSCALLENIIIPDSITDINGGAFYECDSLDNVVIPDSVKVINGWTFSHCYSLKNITIPSSVTSIGDGAFGLCSSLENITIPDSVTSIGSRAFADCSSLKQIIIPDSVTRIDDYAFGYYGITGSAHSGGGVLVPMKSTDFTIYGKTGSTAEDYAKKWGFEFVPTGNIPVMTFPDTVSGDWYYDAVKYNFERGYITGYSNGTFGPSNNIQRQDFVLILARIAGADLSAYEGKNGGFSDVPSNAYYSAAVAWAKDKGIVTGYSADNFGVGTYITREQISLILCRYLGGEASGDVDAIINAYPDGGNTSPWAKAGVAWAVENGIIGNSDYLNPNGNAGRAEVAQIIYNMSNKGML